LQNNTFSGLFIGQKIVALPLVDSTNNYLRNELSKSAPLPEGTVILADHQFAGRGQVNNTWDTEPGKNLTFTILLNPAFLVPDNQFILNKAISIGINDALSHIIGNGVKIKWPNDIYVGDCKLGGILIENIIQGSIWKHAIVGIGLNVNQTNFAPHLKNATSLKKILHKDYEISVLLEAICKNIETQYLQLKAKKIDKINQQYLNRMYRLGEEHLFRTKGIEKPGKIIDVNEHGLLHIKFAGHDNSFSFKEIEFVI
jgi:BirA family biotin operon repressor/biotin-[acetyl-CoA-carboxylase] ligase